MWTKALIQVRIKLWSSRNVAKQKKKKKKKKFSDKCPMHFSETLWSDESKRNIKNGFKSFTQENSVLCLSLFHN